MSGSSESRSVLLAVGAFGFWGVAPIYFKWLGSVSPLEVIAHRVVWSALFLALFMVIWRKAWRLKEIFRTPKLLIGLTVSSLLISVNWFLFVYAVMSGQVLATSLGYFINPLISVLLGVFFLGERLFPRQKLALLLVVAAVFYQIWQVGHLPWIALSLAFSFAFYGLIRKQLGIDTFNGLLFEVLLLYPFALGYLIWLGTEQQLSFMHISLGMDGLLALSGIVTVLPLVLFAASVKGINLALVGFIQYLAPSISFLLAIFLFREPFDLDKLISFAMIWAALVLISVDAWRRLNRGG